MTLCAKEYTDIPFAHRQWRHDGHCKHIHGHNWSFKFLFTSETRDENNFILDFGKLGWLKDGLNVFDHALVLCEDDPYLDQINDLHRAGAADIILLKDTSCEGLAEYLLGWCNDELKQRGLDATCCQVTVKEDSKNSAIAATPFRV